MRIALITIQAAIITLFAVIGAQSDTEAKQSCPLPSAQADVLCRD